MSEDFGSYLKHQRELRGVPLDEIALSTKISIRFLQALEENRFEDLPGEVFIKGFIRSYGEAIGSNADELLAAYLESSGELQAGETSEAPPSKSESTPEAEPVPKGSPIKAMVGFGVALAIITGGVLWVTNQKSSDPPKDSSQAGVAKSDEVDNSLPEVLIEPGEETEGAEEGDSPENPFSKLNIPEPGPAAGTDPKVPVADTDKEPGDLSANKNTVTVPEKDVIIKDLQEQTVPNSADESSGMTPGDQSLTLVIRVDENSWFNLTIDGQRDQDFILPTGGSKTILAKTAIVMTIGNRRATQLTLNQRQLELPESPDNVVRNFIVNTEHLEN